MPESLSDVFQTIPGLVADHPHVAELSQKVKALCNGSEYERAAVDHYFEKAARQRFDLLPRLKKRALDESAKELRILGEKEAEASFPSLSTRASEGFKAVVDSRERQIEKTVTEWMDEQFGLTKAFCERFEGLCGQVVQKVMPVWESSLEGVIDAKLDQELSTRSESLVKAVLGPHGNYVLHWSDLKSEVKT
jgi:hypothetical protein